MSEMSCKCTLITNCGYHGPIIGVSSRQPSPYYDLAIVVCAVMALVCFAVSQLVNN